MNETPPPIGDVLAWMKWAERTIKELSREVQRLQAQTRGT